MCTLLTCIGPKLASVDESWAEICIHCKGQLGKVKCTTSKDNRFIAYTIADCNNIQYINYIIQHNNFVCLQHALNLDAYMQFMHEFFIPAATIHDCYH